MATKKFYDDDLEDYEEYYDEEEDWEAQDERERDEDEYNIITKEKKKQAAAKQVPIETKKSSSSLYSAPKVKEEFTTPIQPVAFGFTANQVTKFSKLREDLDITYPVSTWFLEKAIKTSNPVTAAQSALNNAEFTGDATSIGPAPIVFVVIGHVDAGKSTLMAQLVGRFGQAVINQSSHALSHHRKEKTSRNNLAWEMDVGQDEREHGVTIDAKSKPLSIDGHSFVAIDAPGHADYVPSMLLGAMQAEAAVLVIDCVKFDSGFSRGGQTKEHVSLIRSLGIHQLIVVLNKVDMIDPEDRFDEIESIKSQLKDFIFDEMRFTECDFIPVSAIKGENIFTPIHAEDESSICLKDALIALKPKSHGPVNHSVCIPIVDVSGDRLSGRIECGSVHDKEKLMILPSKQMVQLHTQTRVPGSYLESVQFSFMDSSLNAGASSPTNTGTSAYIHPGSVIVDPLFPLDHIECVETFQARILVINDDFMPIVKGQTITVNVHTCMTDAIISRLIGKINKQGKLEQGHPPKCLVKGDVALVEISLRKGHVIAVEPNASTRVTGRVVIRDRGVTIAAGLVTKQEQL